MPRAHIRSGEIVQSRARPVSDVLASQHPRRIIPSDEDALPSPTYGGILTGPGEGIITVLAINAAEPIAVPVGPYMHVPIVAVMVLESGTTPGLVLTGLYR